MSWWRLYSRDSLAVFSQITVDDLLDELKAQFSDIDEEMKLRDRLLGLKQTGTVSEFTTAFKNLQLRLG